MIVNDILKAKTSQDIATATAEQSVAEVARLLHQKRIGAVVVVDSARRINGILSERDIVRGLAQHGEAVLRLKVGDLMTKDVVVCRRDDLLDSLMQSMTSRRIRHLPVVEEGQLVGIVSIGDVVKGRMEEAAMHIDQMREYVMTAH